MVRQCFILFGCMALGELVVKLTGLKLPSSIIGMLLLTALVGFKIMSVGHINNPMAKGLSLGAASHALGTSVAMDRDEFVGAYASLGLTLDGIFTALCTPTVVAWL